MQDGKGGSSFPLRVNEINFGDSAKGRRVSRLAKGGKILYDEVVKNLRRWARQGACVVGRTANIAKAMEELSNQFKPQELNEGNVQAIFNRCLATEDSKKDPNDTISVQVLDKNLTSKESEPVLLSIKQLNLNTVTVLYLLGQIHLFHKKNNNVFTLQDGFYKYDDTAWTKDHDTLFKLYAVAIGIGGFSGFRKNQNNIIVTRTANIYPTYSPKDPNFQAWWNNHKLEWQTYEKLSKEHSDD